MSQILSNLASWLPLLVSCVSLVVHFVVAHRLKCNKSLSDCLKECLPSIMSTSIPALEERVKELEASLTAIVSFIRGFSEDK